MALGTPPLAWFCATTWPDLSPPLTGPRSAGSAKHLPDRIRQFRFHPIPSHVRTSIIRCHMMKHNRFLSDKTKAQG